MSEPKAFRIIQGDTGGYGAPSYKCDADGNRIEEWSDACEVYDKYEADKVIAELESDKLTLMQRLNVLDGKFFGLSQSHNITISKCGSLERLVAELKARIAELEEERRWRKFPEEKPEEWSTVVVRISNGFYDLAVYLSNGQGWDIGDGLYHKSEEVTHWLPLP